VIGGIDGRIDEVAVFHRALSEAEVRALYEWGRAGKPLPTRALPSERR
jgi:hypothetical protein